MAYYSRSTRCNEASRIKCGKEDYIINYNFITNCLRLNKSLNVSFIVTQKIHSDKFPSTKIFEKTYIMKAAAAKNKIKEKKRNFKNFERKI